MAEWLGTALQKLLQRFESASDLKKKPRHSFITTTRFFLRSRIIFSGVVVLSPLPSLRVKKLIPDIHPQLIRQPFRRHIVRYILPCYSVGTYIPTVLPAISYEGLYEHASAYAPLVACRAAEQYAPAFTVFCFVFRHVEALHAGGGTYVPPFVVLFEMKPRFVEENA